eukprot:c16195_g1_i1 orf=253-1284(+)
MGTLEAKGGGGEEGQIPCKKESSSSAAAFVEGGVQDACDESCSICLEPFCQSDPATVTSCAHEYHVQCILEWAQRSKECPMCWQPLSLKDPASQELLDALEQEQSWGNLDNGIQSLQVPAYANYGDFEERMMQHLAHQLARRGLLQNRLLNMPNDVPSNQVQPAGTTNEQPAREAQQAVAITVDGASHNRWTDCIRSLGAERHHEILEPMHDMQQSSDASSVSESIKSRFLVASSKCKETLTRTTRSLKERWRGRSNKTADFRARAQELHADVVRHALKRISPESVGKDHAPITSTSVSASHSEITESSGKPGASSQTRCTTNNHLEGTAVTGVSRQPPSEAV